MVLYICRYLNGDLDLQTFNKNLNVTFEKINQERKLYLVLEVSKFHNLKWPFSGFLVTTNSSFFEEFEYGMALSAPLSPHPRVK